jgi:hypothetical protein
MVSRGGSHGFASGQAYSPSQGSTRLANAFLAWLFHCGLLCLSDRSNWRNLPHIIPCCQSSLIWNLGCFMACLQSGSDGLYLVRRTIMDWRHLRLPHDTFHMEQLAQCVYTNLAHIVNTNLYRMMVQARVVSRMGSPVLVPTLLNLSLSSCSG